MGNKNAYTPEEVSVMVSDAYRFGKEIEANEDAPNTQACRTFIRDGKISHFEKRVPESVRMANGSQLQNILENTRDQ